MTYEKSVEIIKKGIENYSRKSILDKSMTYFYSIGDGLEERARSMPHIIFLLIKWSMLTQRDGPEDITTDKFFYFADKIHQIQHLAADIKPDGNLMLKLRVMLMQQTIPQKSFQNHIMTLIRQKFWFTKTGNKFYEDSFKRKTGVSLNDFYQVTMYLSALAQPAHPKTRSIPLQDIARHLSPSVKIEDITLVINIFGIRIEEMPAYFKKFELSHNPKIEYFQETPLINKPILIIDNFLLFIENDLFLRSASDFVSKFLKRNDILFKNHFGETLERYVEEIFTKKNIDHHTEINIRNFYKDIGRNGKIVDFIIDGDCRIFLDSKAIEPNSLVATSHDPEVLRSRLEASYIKAIFQGQECCHILSDHFKFPKKISYLLVVVHQDHYISTGSRIEELIQHDLSNKIIEKFGYLPIPLENTYYITIDDLERLAEYEFEKKGGIFEILDSCLERDKLPETQYMLFKMHLDTYGAHQRNKELKKLCMDAYSEQAETITKNMTHWSSGRAQFHLSRQKINKLLSSNQ
ncbi:hypothetical protein JAB1_14830 [Janthinobacterium sp. MP5059B]|uniref:GapS1 family protein n=1 Tax=Janthinobacterium sp. MP5059B TaxID=1766683 RepID=UPI0008930550|nr:hypothetical protein [Janthinobacterium sp. MP5059B]OEZ50368.1 hypothetical protein JAB1_14830 [Janthinobacterium sp. MP5059B]